MESYKLSKYNIFKKKKGKTTGVNLFNKRLFAITGHATGKYLRIMLPKGR
jgi:hypothetical protein